MLVLTGLALAGCGGPSDSGPADTPSPRVELGPKQGEPLTRFAAPEPDLPANHLETLRGVPPPEPRDLGLFVKDRAAAIVLGKALFWDVQAGSDGQACASCHFHAGADNRVRNQLSPGLNNVAGAPRSQTFDPTPTGAGGPNYILHADDFPFHRLADITDPNSTVLFDTDDVSSSQGVFRRDFVSTAPSAPNSPMETCTSVPDIYNVGGRNIRRVEPRNTPTMINAVYFFRNFWDGRANNVFNGVNPFGPRDPNASILELQPDGSVRPIAVRLENASAASQAVGPALSSFEMSCANRSFRELGHKLLIVRPLGTQRVAADDSVLGPYRHGSGRGLEPDYFKLIKQAFDRKYWGYKRRLPSGYLQVEENFSLFWGLAIMLYEQTLVSDDAPIDRYLQGDERALTPQQVYGKALFEGQANCIACHHGSMISGAAFDVAAIRSGEQTETNSLERMALGDGRAALYDNGFYNIGVRPTSEDLGIGGMDPFGNPLSFAREAKLSAAGQPIPEILIFDPGKFSLNRGQPPQPTERDAVDGAFKTPSLRNVELTGPYFHNGGQATLEQVLEFYDRGGDRRGGTTVTFDGERITYGPDSTGFGPNETNMDVDVDRLFLTRGGRAAIVAFLKSFTDERVRWEQAPFDHPELIIPNGMIGDETRISGAEGKLRVPAVGRNGRAALGLPPITPFLE